MKAVAEILLLVRTERESRDALPDGDCKESMGGEDEIVRDYNNIICAGVRVNRHFFPL